MNSNKAIEEMLHIFNSLCPLDDEAKKSISVIFEQKFIPKNTLLVTNGSVVNKIWFLNTGLLRSFFYKDGKECTTWIMLDKFPFTNYRSFITGNPSIDNIVTVEDCVVLETTREKVYKLYDQYPAANALGRTFAEIYFLRHDAHVNSILFSSAEERYNNLMDAMPSIVDRMKDKDIASYLGLTKETYSRILSKYKNIPKTTK